MNEQIQALFESALALPVESRALLIERLLETLPSEAAESLDDDAFADELDRRYAEFLRDPSTGVPWSEVAREH
jgi:putative addiction module component (TIGR02574 family)